MAWYRPSASESLPSQLSLRSESFTKEADTAAGAGAGAAAAAAVAAATVDTTTGLLAAPPVPPSRDVRVRGTLRNTNTVEAFKSLDKAAALQAVGDQVMADITSGAATSDPALLSPFLLLAFADLKAHKFVHWAAFPALVPSRPFHVAAHPQPLPAAQLHTLKESLDGLRDPVHRALPLAFLVSRPTRKTDALKALPLSAWPADGAASTGAPWVGFVDPCPNAEHPGWPLRNVLAYCRLRLGVTRATVVCFRSECERAATLSAHIWRVVMTACCGGVVPLQSRPPSCWRCSGTPNP